MLRSDRMRTVIALCVVAAWASLAGLSFADTIEDARKVSPHEDSQNDQAVQQALVTPAVRPTSLLWSVTPAQPTFEPSHQPLAHAFSSARFATSHSWNAALHDPPPLLHRFTLFQLFSVYRL